MSRFTTAQLDGMVRDAERLARVSPLLGRDVACHVKALAAEAEQLAKAEEFIREVAWRFSDYAAANWSGPDVLAHVADYFGCTVAELLKRMEDAGR